MIIYIHILSYHNRAARKSYQNETGACDHLFVSFRSNIHDKPNKLRFTIIFFFLLKLQHFYPICTQLFISRACSFFRVLLSNT